MSDMQFQAVYNVLSFTLASMMSTTMYLWFRAGAVQDKYKSAVFISGLVTFIAAYHYIRIFNPRVEDPDVMVRSDEGHQTRDEHSALVLVLDSSCTEPEVHGGCQHARKRK